MKIIGINILSRIVYVDVLNKSAQGVYQNRNGEYFLYSFFFGSPECIGMLPISTTTEGYKISTRKPSNKAIRNLGKIKYKTFTNKEIQKILCSRIIVNGMIKEN